MRKIEITKMEDCNKNTLVFIEGQKCSFCGDIVVKGHFNGPFYCTHNKNDIKSIEDREMIKLDIDSTNDNTKIFDENFNGDLIFEIHTRIDDQDQDIQVITFQNEEIWNADMLNNI